MSDTAIDRLEIEINAESQSANDKIDVLCNKITNLSKVLKEVETGNFSKISSGISGINSALKGVEKNNADSLKNIAASINAFSKVNTDSFSSISNSLKTLKSGINEIGKINFNTAGLDKVAESIRLFGYKTSTVGTANLSVLKTELLDFATGLNRIGSINFDISSLQNVVSNISKLGGKSATKAVENLPYLKNQLLEFANGLKGVGTIDISGITELVSNISKLGGKATVQAVKNIPQLATAMKKLITDLSKAPKVSQNLIDMTDSLAKLARTGSSGGKVINSLSGNVESMSSKFSSAKNSFGSFNNSLNKVKVSVSNLTSSLKSIIGQVAGFVAIFSAIKKSIDISSDLTEVQNVVDTTFGSYAGMVEDMSKTSITDFGMSESTVKNVSSQFQAMGTAMGFSQGKMADMSIELTKLTADMASFYNVEQNDVAKSLQSVFTGETEPLRKYGLDLTNATLQEWALNNGLNANISSMSQMEKTTLRYQYVLANTSAAQGDFAKTANTWSNQVRILKQNFEVLGSIVGGVVINALKPFVKAMNTIMVQVNSFAKSISNALGKIFGWTFEESSGGIASDFEAAEDSAGGLVDSTGEVADNVEKMKARLRVFDELKTISISNSSSSSGGSSGGASTDLGSSSDSSGEWTQTDSLIKSFESEIDNLFELGKHISDTLSEALESINWDSIYEKARNFGIGLADFLNGLISPRLFGNIGATIAGSLNTALNFLDSFGETFDWSNFGNSLAAGINNFVSTIDWNTALSSAQNWGNGIATTLNDFLSNTNFYGVGATVANALNTSIQFSLSLGTTIDFEEVGLSIADSINGFFDTVDFANLANSINAWAKGIWKTIRTAIANINWLDVWNGVDDFLRNIDIETVSIIIGVLTIKGILSLKIASTAFSMVGTAISRSIAQAIASKLGIEIAANAGIKTALTTGLITAFTSIGTTFMAGLKGLLGSKAATSALAFISPITKAITGIGTLLSGVVIAISNFFSMLKKGFSWLNEILMVIGIAVAAVAAVILGVPATVAAVVAAIVAAVGTAVVLIKEHWTEIKEAFLNVWEEIKKVWSKVSGWFNDNVIKPIASFFKELWKNVSGFFTNLWNDIKKVWSKVSGWFNDNVITPLVSFFQGLWTRVKQIFEGLWIIVQAVWKVASGWFQSYVITPIINLFSPIVSKIGGFFSNLWNGVKSVWGSASSWFNTKITTPVSNAFQTACNKIGGFFASLWKGIKKGVASAMNFVISGIEKAVNGIVSGINGIIGGFNKIVTVSAKIVGANWSGVDKLSKVSLTRINVNKFETGGFPKQYSMFMAGENGTAELIGTVGGKTAVAGGAEITGISDTIRATSSEEVTLLRQQNQLLQAILQKEYGITKNDIGKAAQSYAKEYARRTGKEAYSF